MTARRGRIIINGDDLGIHPSINDGIRDAYEHGILTSASMLMTTPFLRETVETVVRKTALPTGLHLSLTLGKALAPAALLSDLVDESGNFKLPASYFIMLHGAASARIGEQIRREFEAQFAAARDSGIALSHVDSHQHVHMNPQIFAIVEAVAERFGVRCLRFSREPFLPIELTAGLLRNLRQRNFSKLAIARICAAQIQPRLKTSDWYFGLAYSGEISPKALIRVFDRVSRTGTTCEIGIHPGYPSSEHSGAYADPAVRRFIAAPSRRNELELLLDPELRAELRKRDIALASFRDIAA